MLHVLSQLSGESERGQGLAFRNTPTLWQESTLGGFRRHQRCHGTFGEHSGHPALAVTGPWRGVQGLPFDDGRSPRSSAVTAQCGGLVTLCTEVVGRIWLRKAMPTLQAGTVRGVEGGQLPARSEWSPDARVSLQQAVLQVRSIQVVLGFRLCFQVHPGRESDQLSLGHTAGSQPRLARG